MIIFSFIKKKYLNYCKKHSFNPVLFLIVTAVIIALIVCMLVKLVFDIKKEPTVVYESTVVYETIPGKITKIEFNKIGELATHSAYYTSVQTIRGAQELWGWKVPFTEAECVFSLDGEIEVGYDFSLVEIEADEETKVITVRMPAAKVLSNSIDPHSLRIYDEDKNIFTPLQLSEVGIKLEQVQAESEEEAIAKGVFDNAKDNAEILITGFLSGIYDMNEYHVEFVHED